MQILFTLFCLKSFEDWIIREFGCKWENLNSGELNKQKWNVKRIREFTQSMPRKWAEQKEGKVQPRLSQAVCSDGMRGWLLCRVLVPRVLENICLLSFWEFFTKRKGAHGRQCQSGKLKLTVVLNFSSSDSYNVAYKKHTLSFSGFSFFRNVLANFIHPPALSPEFASSTGSFPLPFMSRLAVPCLHRKNCSYNALLIF